MLAAFSFSAGMQAQKANEPRKERRQIDRVEMSQKMATRMADELKLDDKTQAWFVPIYTEYQDSLRSLRRLARPVSEMGQKVDVKTLTDAQALALVESTLMVSEMETALKRTYFGKLKERLTPQQLVSIFCRQPRLQLPENRRFNGQRPHAFRPNQGNFPVERRSAGDNEEF